MVDVKVHVVKYPNGSLYPCVCQIGTDHEAEPIFTPEEVAMIALEKQTRNDSEIDPRKNREIDHSALSDKKWDLIKNRSIKDAKITNVWVDKSGNTHVELVYDLTQNIMDMLDGE